jgi:hypothetical protein
LANFFYGFAPLGGAAIEDYLLKRNANPKPYRWHAKGHDILAKIERARRAAADYN